jgi:hypothetical protein
MACDGHQSSVMVPVPGLSPPALYPVFYPYPYQHQPQPQPQHPWLPPIYGRRGGASGGPYQCKPPTHDGQPSLSAPRRSHFIHPHSTGSSAQSAPSHCSLCSPLLDALRYCSPDSKVNIDRAAPSCGTHSTPSSVPNLKRSFAAVRTNPIPTSSLASYIYLAIL